MKNKLFIASAVILSMSIALCACGTDKNEEETTTESITAIQTEAQSQTITFVDESGYHVISRVDAPTQERTHPPVPSRTNQPTYRVETVPQTQGTTRSPVTLAPNTTSATANHYPNQTSVDLSNQVTVPEKANGLSIQFKSNPVIRGNDATIAVNGQAGKEYVIEVYKNDKDLYVSDKLKSQTANSLGVILWTFDTDSLNSGYRKIIIREKNSDKYIQTSITVL
ncbi:MAG: hypothetical protein J6R20_04525 [Clostridia bacterium]|nr:hypothetical protein [Clostridia bacterium]